MRRNANMPLIPFEAQLGRSVSLDQASQMLGVSRRTVYNWIRDGRLHTIRTLGGSQRVLVESMRESAGLTGVIDKNGTVQ